MNFFTKIATILSISLASSLSAQAEVSANASTFDALQNCKIVYGSGPFTALTLQYKVVGKAAANWSIVDVSVAVERHSDFEAELEFQPIVETNVHTAALNNLEIYFADASDDYASGTITFEFDENKGDLAIVEFGSDGPSGLAVFECEAFPKI